MKKTIFKGMATAMVTPMTPEGVDYEALGRFIDFQLESGINALVAVGTTGESATLTPEERDAIPVLRVGEAHAADPVFGVQPDFAPCPGGQTVFVEFYKKDRGESS